MNKNLPSLSHKNTSQDCCSIGICIVPDRDNVIWVVLASKKNYPIALLKEQVAAVIPKPKTILEVYFLPSNVKVKLGVLFLPV